VAGSVNQAPDAQAVGALPTLAATGGRRHGIAIWVLRRLALGVVTLFVVSLMVFVVTHVLPADPARSILGHFAPPAQLEAVREQLKLNDRLPQQYLSWLGDLAHGSLGTSFATREEVTGEVGTRLGNSLTLLAVVSLIAVPLSMAIGVIAARHRDGVFDSAVVGVCVALAGLPEFVIGLLLVALFATSAFDVLPAIYVLPPGENPITDPKGLVLPTATLVLAVVPYLARLFRGSMIEALETSYVEMARLKGIPERVVLLRHALPNALVPGIQGTGLALMYLLGNVVVVEYLFNFPGLGTELASAVSQRDLPMIQGIAMVFAAMFVLFNILADLLTVYATPRLRTEV
jgi:peptide/nickel transport system permease protein